jgi:hypothetical protein
MGTILMAHIGTVAWGAPDRLQQTHTILKAHPYLRLKRLITIACPDTELEKQCQKINDDFWISRGRPEVVRPIPEKTKKIQYRII